MKIAALLPPEPVYPVGKNDAAQHQEQLRATCQEFEALLVQQVLKSMRATIPDSGLLEKDASRDTYKDMLDIQVARGIANQRGGVGIGKTLYQQMQKLEAAGQD